MLPHGYIYQRVRDHDAAVLSADSVSPTAASENNECIPLCVFSCMLLSLVLLVLPVDGVTSTHVWHYSSRLILLLTAMPLRLARGAFKSLITPLGG